MRRTKVEDCNDRISIQGIYRAGYLRLGQYMGGKIHGLRFTSILYDHDEGELEIEARKWSLARQPYWPLCGIQPQPGHLYYIRIRKRPAS